MHSTWQAGLATAAVVVLAAVLLRRRPLMALAVLLVGSLAAAAASSHRGHAPPAPVTSLLLVLLVVLAGLAVCFIAATLARRVSVTAAIVTIGVQAACQAEGLAGTARRGPAPFLGTSLELAVALITVIAWLIGHSIRQTHHHALTLRAQADAQAVTAERLQIARDLHDQIAHAIGIIAIQAGMGSRVIDTQPGQARNALTAIEATSRQTLTGLRQTVRALRQPAPRPQSQPAPLDPLPGLAGLGQLTAVTRDVGVDVGIQWRGQRRPLPADIDACAFRIIQEAVTNVVRHAGTSSCHLLIDQAEDELRIEVTDSGRGSTAASAGSGYGIAGMRERAALLHGQITAGPRPEGGFRVTALLPVPTAAR